MIRLKFVSDVIWPKQSPEEAISWCEIYPDSRESWLMTVRQTASVHVGALFSSLRHLVLAPCCQQQSETLPSWMRVYLTGLYHHNIFCGIYKNSLTLECKPSTHKGAIMHRQQEPEKRLLGHDQIQLIPLREDRREMLVVTWFQHLPMEVWFNSWCC